MKYSFFDATGAFSGRTFSGSLRLLRINTPAGYTAIEGVYDPLSQRVDVAALARAEPGDFSTAVDFVVAYTPQADHPLLLQRRRANARERIEALYRRQDDVVRAILLAWQNLPAAARTQLQAIEDEIAEMRSRL